MLPHISRLFFIVFRTYPRRALQMPMPPTSTTRLPLGRRFFFFFFSRHLDLKCGVAATFRENTPTFAQRADYRHTASCASRLSKILLSIVQQISFITPISVASRVGFRFAPRQPPPPPFSHYQIGCRYLFFDEPLSPDAVSSETPQSTPLSAARRKRASIFGISRAPAVLPRLSAACRRGAFRKW